MTAATVIHVSLCCGNQGRLSQSFLDRKLAVVDAFDAVAERLFNNSDVSDEAFESARFDGCRLVAAPHRAIQRDMALNVRGAECDSGDRRRKSDLVARVAHGAREFSAERFDHSQIQLGYWAWVCAGGMHNDEIVFT